MKDNIETRIIDSQPYGRGNKEFVTHTLSAIKKVKTSETFSEVLRRTNINHKEKLFMRFVKVNRALALGIGIVLTLSLSFTGYAYASGTNPVALIRKLINQGKTVEVEYEGRKFQYGAKNNYSDAAITAYAELNTVSDLHFQASNSFQIPINGVEYVSDPYNTKYVYPWVGTIESVNSQTVRIHKQYIVGDKLEPSRQVDEQIELPIDRVNTYKQGEVTEPSAITLGRVVTVYQDQYLKHRIGSTDKPVLITHHFVFELTHDLASIQEAAKSSKDSKDDTQTAIFEPSWGGATNICLNNGADLCDADKQGSTDGQSLFTITESPNQPYSNPDVIPFGEGVPDSLRGEQDLIIRNTQGKIINITEYSIIIESSSGTHWTFDYSLRNQLSFGQIHKPLAIGDNLVVSVVGSVNDLDNRHFDNKHIYALQRF